MKEAEDQGDFEAPGKYPAFMIRRLLSYHKDAILWVNEMNQFRHLDSDLEYQFLLNVLPKRSRFAKTHKPQKPEQLDLVMRFYNYSEEKAMEVLDLHTEEEFRQMRDYFAEGGVIKKDRK